jgi:hypothetical protein
MYFTGFALTFAFFRILIWQQGGKNVYLEILGIFVSMMFLVVLVCCRNGRRPGYGEGEHAAHAEGVGVRRGDGTHHFLARYLLGDDIYDRYYATYMGGQTGRIPIDRPGLTREEIAQLPRIRRQKRPSNNSIVTIGRNLFKNDEEVDGIEMTSHRNSNSGGSGTETGSGGRASFSGGSGTSSSHGRRGSGLRERALKLAMMIGEDNDHSHNGSPDASNNQNNYRANKQGLELAGDLYDSELQQPLPLLSSPPRIKPNSFFSFPLTAQHQHQPNSHPNHHQSPNQSPSRFSTSSSSDFTFSSLFPNHAVHPLNTTALSADHSQSPPSSSNFTIPSPFGKLATIAVMRDSESSTASAMVDGKVSRRMSEEHRLSLLNCCPICLSDYTNEDLLIVLPCHHEYHEECITEWLLQQASCPMCKHDLRPDVRQQDTSYLTTVQPTDPASASSPFNSNSQIDLENTPVHSIHDMESDSNGEAAHDSSV